MRQPIPFDKFNTNIFHLWDKQWFLLTSGDFQANDYNTMTVAWGYFGMMCSKPTAVVVVRPVRHTYNFTEKHDTFTLCAFPEKYQDDLTILGSKSGRDGNKIAETDLTVCKSKIITAPGFDQAELTIECKKSYWDDFKPENFLDRTIEEKYPQKDYHRMYFGEILQINGTDKFLK